VVKKNLNDYQGALQNLNIANDLEENNAPILQWLGDVIRMLEDYEGALECFDQANALVQMIHAFYTCEEK
jgi:tetratricopeptide (TPR) repeat protein